MSAAKTRKSNKPNYVHLLNGLEERGLSVDYYTLEIGSLGHYEPNAIQTISQMFSLPKK